MKVQPSKILGIWAILLVSLVLGCSAEKAPQVISVRDEEEMPDQIIDGFLLLHTEGDVKRVEIDANRAEMYTPKDRAVLNVVRSTYYGDDGRVVATLASNYGEINTKSLDVFARGDVVVDHMEEKGNRRQHLEADRGSYLNAQRKIFLDRFTGWYYEGDRLATTVRADDAEVDLRTNDIVATGNVVVVSDTGARLETEKLIYISGRDPNLPGWEFEKPGDPQGWTPADQVQVVGVEGGELKLKTLGNSSSIFGPPNMGLSADRTGGFSIRMRATGGSRGLLEWITSLDPQWGRGKVVSFDIASDGAFHTYEVMVRNSPAWDGRVERLRVRPTDSPAEVEIDFIRPIYLYPLGDEAEARGKFITDAPVKFTNVDGDILEGIGMDADIRLGVVNIARVTGVVQNPEKVRRELGTGR